MGADTGQKADVLFGSPLLWFTVDQDVYSFNQSQRHREGSGCKKRLILVSLLSWIGGNSVEGKALVITT